MSGRPVDGAHRIAAIESDTPSAQAPAAPHQRCCQSHSHGMAPLYPATAQIARLAAKVGSPLIR